MILVVLVMAVAGVGAILAASQPNIVRAIFGLGIALSGIALAFLLLGSPFLAAMEVLIYIGGITVAMAFGVMLSTAGRHERGETGARRILAALVAAAVFVGIGLILKDATFPKAPETEAAAWSIERIGAHLLDQFNVVFELLSVVLLTAIIGAIAIASRADEHRDPTAPEEDAA